MQRFDKRGMLIIPNPVEKPAASLEEVIVVSELFCPSGHSLINNRATFNGHRGILVEAVQGEGAKGLLALSPVYGEKSRVALGLDLVTGERLVLRCPECNLALPVHSPCGCGGDLVALFLTPEASFTQCIGVCDRVDCVNAKVISGGELITMALGAAGG